MDGGATIAAAMCVAEDGLAEVGALEIGPSEVDALRGEIREYGAAEVGARQV